MLVDEPTADLVAVHAGKITVQDDDVITMQTQVGERVDAVRETSTAMPSRRSPSASARASRP